MSGKAATAEHHILELFQNQNRPFSVQVVADFVAQFGIKKAQVQKTMDTLAEKGKITVKEFGKTRIFWPIQSNRDVLTKEETDAKKQQVNESKALVKKEEEELHQLKKEYAALKSMRTLEEIESEIQRLETQKEESTEKLSTLKEKSVVVQPEERATTEKKLRDHLRQWKNWKSAFSEIWGALSENLNRNKKEVFEEIGIEVDEESGCSIDEINRLMPDNNKRRRCK